MPNAQVNSDKSKIVRYRNNLKERKKDEEDLDLAIIYEQTTAALACYAKNIPRLD